jgi:hypothetical protein
MTYQPAGFFSIQPGLLLHPAVFLTRLLHWERATGKFKELIKLRKRLEYRGRTVVHLGQNRGPFGAEPWSIWGRTVVHLGQNRGPFGAEPWSIWGRFLAPFLPSFLGSIFTPFLGRWRSRICLYMDVSGDWSAVRDPF